MRCILRTSLGVTVLLLAGCEMKVPRAKTAAPPQPAAARPEPPPEPASNEPLSIPQTQVRLPAPQPINPEALATPPSPPAEPSQPHPSRRPRRQAPQPASASPAGKPEAAETADVSPPTEERPPIGPVLSDDERRRLNEDISSRLKDVDQMLARLSALRLSDAEKNSVERIRSFQKLSRDAQEHGLIQQASALADRAVLLAQEVLRGR